MSATSVPRWLGGAARVLLAGAIAVSVILPALAAGVRHSHNGVILLFDVSASMQKSDPSCVRKEAALLLLSMLDPGDRVAVVEFGDRITAVTKGWVRLGDERRRVERALSRCRNEEKYTDIVGALGEAITLVERLGDEGRRATPPSVIILTDGQDTSPRKDPGREQKILEELKVLAGYGVQVHSVGLSRQADRDLLRQFSEITGGDNCWVEKPRDLLQAFFALSRRLGRRWLVREIESARPGTIELPVPEWADGGVLLFVPRTRRGGGVLQVEGKGSATDRGLYQVLEFDENPGATLRVRVPRPGGRLVWDVKGDLFLTMDLPSTVPQMVGFPCKARIRARDDRPLGRVDFLRQMNVEFQWDDGGLTKTIELYDNGSGDDAEPFDGVFSGTCFARTAGELGWTARGLAPLSPSLEARGKTRVAGQEEMVTISFSWDGGRAIFVNQTDVPVKVIVDVLDGKGTEAVQSHDLLLEPGRPRSIDLPRGPLGMGHASIRLRWPGQEGGSLESREVEARGLVPWWLPRALLAALVLLLVSGFLFPRTSLRNAKVRVRVLDEDGLDLEEGVARIAGDGRARFTDIEDAFADAGLFRPVHGFLRRGKVYWVPPEGVTPIFGKRVSPWRAGNGYRFGNYARWKVNRDGKAAEYTFRLG